MSHILSYIVTGQDRLSPVIARAGKNVERSGSSMAKAFGAVSKAFAAVSIIGTAASVKVAVDFEDSMQKIVGLVGISQKQVDKWGQSILSMATTLPQAPKELADALYFITSAGIPAGQAMFVLKASAKAAAAGLGSTATVADAVTSALNAYRGTGLNAARTTDILTAAVREGKAEAEDFSGSIGRVIPVASTLGVKFDEVAAAMASMTLTGLDADEAATATRGILNSLIKPTVAGTDALKKMGLSYSSIREQIKEKGLLNVLLMLKARFGENKEAMARVFPNVRALNGFLSLTGKNAGQTRDIFGSLSKATGDTDRAFKAASETARFKFNVAMNKLRVVGIQFGAAIIPILTAVATKLMQLVGPALKSKAAFITLGVGVTATAVVFKAAMMAMATSAKTALITSVVGIAILALTIAIYALMRNWKTVMKGLRDALSATKNFAIEMIRKIVNGLLWLIGTIIHGAASAFGWLPFGIGKSLKAAARKFDDFRAKVNASLEGLKSRRINIGVDFKSAGWGKTIGAGPMAAKPLARGGPISGPGTSTSDSIPALLSNDEYVVNAKSHRHYGTRFFDALNARKFAKGGSLGLSTAFPNPLAVAKAMSDMALRGVKQWAQSWAMAGPIGAVGGGVQRWAGLVLRALSLLGQPSSWLGVVLHRMNQESGGNPRAINLWDSNARAGTPSIGLMQVIGPTFAAYANGFRGLGIWNPFANIFAGLNYALHRYGSLAALMRAGGYDKGGWLMPGYTLAYNGTGRPERVLGPGQGGDTYYNITVNHHGPTLTPRDQQELGRVVVSAIQYHVNHGGKLPKSR